MYSTLEIPFRHVHIIHNAASDGMHRASNLVKSINSTSQTSQDTTARTAPKLLLTIASARSRRLLLPCVKLVLAIKLLVRAAIAAVPPFAPPLSPLFPSVSSLTHHPYLNKTDADFSIAIADKYEQGSTAMSLSKQMSRFKQDPAWLGNEANIVNSGDGVAATPKKGRAKKEGATPRKPRAPPKKKTVAKAKTEEDADDEDAGETVMEDDQDGEGGDSPAAVPSTPKSKNNKVSISLPPFPLSLRV